MSFPQTGQLPNEYYQDPADLFAGNRYAIDFNNDVVPSALIGNRTEVGQQDTVTVTWVADDQFGFVYDGVTIVATADTDDTLSAVALETAANAAIAGALAGQMLSVSAAAGVLTVVSVAGTGAHTLADYEPDLTTVAIANTVAAVDIAKVVFGMGVVQDATFPDLITSTSSAVRDPRTSVDALWGIMAAQTVSNFSSGTLTELGLDPSSLAPAPVAYQAIKRGRILVPWIGTLPVGKGTQPVFWINDAAAPAADRGFFRTDAAGVAVAVANVEVERIITRPVAGTNITGFVGINFKVTL